MSTRKYIPAPTSLGRVCRFTELVQRLTFDAAGTPRKDAAPTKLSPPVQGRSFAEQVAEHAARTAVRAPEPFDLYRAIVEQGHAPAMAAVITVYVDGSDVDEKEAASDDYDVDAFLEALPVFVGKSARLTAALLS